MSDKSKLVDFRVIIPGRPAFTVRGTDMDLSNLTGDTMIFITDSNREDSCQLICMTPITSTVFVYERESDIL